MSGYHGFSMSNRAVEAYRNGLRPASKIKRVPAELIRQYVSATEWHHTSKHYNETDFYDPAEVLAVFGIEQNDDYEVDQEAVEALARYKQSKKEVAVEVYENCRVKWLEWSGTRRHPKATECTETGCLVTVKNQTATVQFPNGRTMTKRTYANGFFFSQSQDV